MFKKWFSRPPKETKETKEDILLDGLKDQLGWIIFSVDNDGIINMDFDFDTDIRSNQNFSELFDQIHNGDLLKTSIAFVRDSLKHQERTSDMEEFNKNIEVLKKMRNDILSDLSTQENEEVVVKPTDIAKLILKDEDK